jgi:urea transport system permease protein
MRHLLLLLVLLRLDASELDPAALAPLAAERASERAAALQALAASGDLRLVAFLKDYQQGSAFLWRGQVVLVLEDLAKGAGQPLHPLTRAQLSPPEPATSFSELPLTTRDRRAVTAALTRLRLADPDPVARLSAVTRAGDDRMAELAPALAELAARDSDARVRRAAAEGAALIALGASVPAERAAAAETLGRLASSRAADALRTAAKDADGAVRTAAGAALARIETRQTAVRTAQTIFSGLSAGSILIVMALGLAITFGLMGVINMAHGEMLMIGAYATLLVQWLFAWALPAAWMPAYFPLGLLAGFGAAAVVGWLLELTVLRHLYGRPLETLLATIGIGQVLIWGMRRAFGDNQAVVAPAWLTGGWEPVADLVLPWNRLFIIAVTVASVAGVWLLMNRTRLGLVLRATVQSRRTAAALGVDTRRIDGLAFAFGSGLAGAAGCALTLIGGLKPDMGQEFIIDSFLVVAAGGVGSLWGVVCSGLGIGLLGKFLEPWTQAVFAKVLVLALVILFLQGRPQGLFPPRGRLAHD